MMLFQQRNLLLINLFNNTSYVISHLLLFWLLNLAFLFKDSQFQKFTFSRKIVVFQFHYEKVVISV